MLLSPFIGPMRKKRKLPVSKGTGTPTAFNPTKPVPIEDVKAVIDFCTTWKSNIRLGFKILVYCPLLVFFNFLSFWFANFNFVSNNLDTHAIQ